MSAPSVVTLPSCKTVDRPINPMVMPTELERERRSILELTPGLQIVLVCAIFGVFIGDRVGALAGTVAGLAANGLISFLSRSR